MLSEYAVLGYEYGYSLAEPNALVLWEAQFGDFVNGAQIMIDQFISSGEAKWLRMSGLVMLLPHGYEGQGPEHSSARLERFLQMCAARQLDRGELHDAGQLLPHPAPADPPQLPQAADPDDAEVAAAPQARGLEAQGLRQGLELPPRALGRRRLGPSTAISPTKLVPDDKIKRVVLCSGKVYYDLLEERDARGIDDVYLMRLEQFYPFPALSLTKELGRFKQAQIVWCQEEPKNQGGWTFVEPNLEWVLGRIDAKHGAADLCRPPGRRLAGDRARARAQGAAGGAGRRGADRQEGPLRHDRDPRADARRERHRGDRRHLVQEGGRRRSRSTRCSASSRPTR